VKFAIWRVTAGRWSGVGRWHCRVAAAGAASGDSVGGVGGGQIEGRPGFIKGGRNKLDAYILIIARFKIWRKMDFTKGIE
jgi:hypothetical protein